MRKKATVAVGEAGALATVLEIDVETLEQIIGRWLEMEQHPSDSKKPSANKKIQSVFERTLEDLKTGKELLHKIVILPSDMRIEKLSASEITDIIEKFIGLHAGFFLLMKRMGMPVPQSFLLAIPEQQS